MRRLASIVLLALPLALAACGDEESTTTVTETTAATETTPPGGTETSATVAAPGPTAELTSTGVGGLERGDSVEDAKELFGPPIRTQKGPGCELNPDSGGALALTYNFADGELILDFDAASEELGSYRSTSLSFQTPEGDAVGEPFADLQANQGDALEPLVLGSEEPSTKAGIWQVTDGDNALLFDIRGGKVAAISGGHIEICE